MSKLNKILLNILTPLLITGGVVLAQDLGATICFPYQGCTGTNSVPTTGQLLVGNSGGTYTPTSTITVLRIDGNATSTGAYYIGGDLTVNGTTNVQNITLVNQTINGNATTTGYASIGSAMSGFNYANGYLNVQNGIFANSATTTDTLRVGGALTAVGETFLTGGARLLFLNATSSLIDTLKAGAATTTRSFYFPSGVVKENGSVGIGTTAPTYTLDVQGAGGSGSLNVNGYIDFGGKGRMSGDTGVAYIRGRSGNALSLGSNDVTNRIWLDTGGNVGIGTTGPGSKLEVWKTTGNEGNIFNVSSTTAGDLVVIKNSGNVGIGTTGPNRVLHIDKGAADTEIQIGSNQSYWQGLFLGTPGGSEMWDISRAPGGDLHFISGASYDKRVTIQQSGNVGIGTTGPDQKLEVVGAIVSSSGPAAYITNKAWGGFYSTASGGGAYPFLENLNLVIQPRTSAGAARDIIFATGDTTPSARMVIDRLGNVGIGTITPAARLNASSTTEQLRLSYDDVNNKYASFKVLAGGDLKIQPGSVATTTIIGSGLKVEGNATTTQSLTLSSYNCSANANGGKLTTNANGLVACADDQIGLSGISQIQETKQKFNYGWLGLIGILGLCGLFRRRN